MRPRLSALLARTAFWVVGLIGSAFIVGVLFKSAIDLITAVFGIVSAPNREPSIFRQYWKFARDFTQITVLFACSPAAAATIADTLKAAPGPKRFVLIAAITGATLGAILTFWLPAMSIAASAIGGALGAICGYIFYWIAIYPVHWIWGKGASFNVQPFAE